VELVLKVKEVTGCIFGDIKGEHSLLQDSVILLTLLLIINNIIIIQLQDKDIINNNHHHHSFIIVEVDKIPTKKA
jgi:hypothetical protein